MNPDSGKVHQEPGTKPDKALDIEADSLELDQEALTYLPAIPEELEADTNSNSAQTAPGNETEGSIAEERRYPLRERSTTVRFAPGTAMVANMTIGIEPMTIGEALQSGEAKEWSNAIKSELHSLGKHLTWKIVERPPHTRVIPTRFIFNLKINATGTIERFKVRLVVKGYMQGAVDDTYAPV